jgi:hypothetical protein
MDSTGCCRQDTYIDSTGNRRVQGSQALKICRYSPFRVKDCTDKIGLKVYQMVIYTIYTQNKRDRGGVEGTGLAERVLNNLQRTRLSPFRMIWLLSHPSPSHVSKLDQRHIGRLRKRDNLLVGERAGESGGGPKSYAGDKAWSSI